MPTQTAIVAAGIVLVFAAFAVNLTCADFYTQNSAPRVAPNSRNLSIVACRVAPTACVVFPTDIRHGRLS